LRDFAFVGRFRPRRWGEICKAAGSPWATVQGEAIAKAALLPPAKSSGLRDFYRLPASFLFKYILGTGY
jgi:hypothetical protein